jgi:hypothetical protein
MTNIFLHAITLVSIIVRIVDATVTSSAIALSNEGSETNFH